MCASHAVAGGEYKGRNPLTGIDRDIRYSSTSCMASAGVLVLCSSSREVRTRVPIQSPARSCATVF